ncbi:hypothetical protein P3G55_05345 [Leptospira sp. 96542]|nr:hypothetical protein [Leptospira sp. 96542]
MNPILNSILGIAKSKKFRYFLLVFLIYKSVFNAFTADRLFPFLVSKFTQSKLEANWKTFSLFFGIEAESFRFYPGGGFSNVALIEADRFAIRYNLPLILFGKISLSDITLQNAHIHLEEKAGVWNYENIALPSVEEKKEESVHEPSEGIKTYLPLQFFASINFESVEVDVKKETGDLHSLNLQDLVVKLDIVSNRFTNLPFSPAILEELDSVHLVINKPKPIPIHLDSKDVKWNQTIPLALELEWDRTVSPELFLFSSEFGSEEIMFEVRNKPVKLGFGLFSNIDFDTKADKIEIKNLLLSVLGSPWLSIKGDIKNVSSEDRYVDVTVVNSDIKLTPVQVVLNQLQGVVPNMKLGGELSLAGTSFRGNWNKIISSLRLNGESLFFQLGNSKPHKLNAVDVNAKAELSLGDKKEPTNENPIPILKAWDIFPSTILYNGLKLELNSRYREAETLVLNAKLEELYLADYVTDLGGKLKLDLNAEGANFSVLKVYLSAKIDSFRYSLDRSRSPSSILSVITNMNLFFREPFELTNIDVSDLQVLKKTPTGGKALDLFLKSKIQLGDTTQVLVNRLKVSMITSNLALVIPLVIKEKLVPVQSLLGENPEVDISANCSFGPTQKKIKTNLNANIPGLEIKDLNLNADLVMNSGPKESIQIKSFVLSAFQKKFNLNLKADLEKNNTSKPTLGPYTGVVDLDLKLTSKTKTYLAKGTSFSGDLGINLKINQSDIFGEFYSTDSMISYSNHKCPGEFCQLYLVEGINAKIPIHHNLNRSNEESMIVGDKSIFIKSYGRTLPPNLTIGQLVGTHPNIPDLPFEYIKKQPGAPGFSTFIEYKENYANIESLKSHSLDGLILGKNMIFNLGSLDPKFMEFRGNFLIRDVDLKQLMAPKTRDKIDDGKLKADLNISVRDLSEPISNLNLFFSIFQIGKDFGKSAMNVISAQNFIIDRITDSYPISKIDVSLSKGLVYADVYFDRSLLSLLINLEDGKLSQQRMPLANFLKRAQSEIQTYQE